MMIYLETVGFIGAVDTAYNRIIKGEVTVGHMTGYHKCPCPQGLHSSTMCDRNIRKMVKIGTELIKFGTEFVKI